MTDQADTQGRLPLSAGLPQRGAALVMALVILLILTILGITAIGTSSLEEKMAGNIQETTRAFEAAESGLNKAFNDANAYNINNPTTTPFTFDSGRSGSGQVVTTFKYASERPPSSTGITSVNQKIANFEQVSTASTLTGAKSEIHQGVIQDMQSIN